MTDRHSANMEQALAGIEADINSTLKTASAVVGSLKKASAAAKTGNFRDINKSIEAAGQSIAELRSQFSGMNENWAFNEEEYIASREYLDELIQAAKAQGVGIFEQDGLLFCYPFLLRILPGERSVQIGKTKDQRLRPSALAERLKGVQNKPIRFKPDAFLECLYAAYKKLAKGPGEVVALMEIYKLLTLLPGQAKEYTSQEFARDIYLLDNSGLNVTRAGLSMRLPASTGAKTSKNAMRVITAQGHEVRYYGVSFRAE